MLLLICTGTQCYSIKKASNSIVDYSPIAKALSTLDASTQAAVSRKFELTYMMCKEGLAPKKMSTLCELEEKHGVNLGTGYKNDIACAEFVSYISKAEGSFYGRSPGQ